MHYLHHYQIIEREPATIQNIIVHQNWVGGDGPRASETTKRRDGALVTLTSAKYVSTVKSHTDKTPNYI